MVQSRSVFGGRKIGVDENSTDAFAYLSRHIYTYIYSIAE